MSDSPSTSSRHADDATVASGGTVAVPDSRDVGAADQPWQSLAPQSVTIERIVSWIFTLVLSAVGAGVIGSILLQDWPPDWLGPILIAVYLVAVLGLMVASHVMPAIAYRHTRYRLSGIGFEIRRGIFWRSSIVVPHSRVQHTDVAQGPLQRTFHLGKLIVFTAGTQHASVELNGINFQTACTLRDALVGRLEGTDGV